jgi:streptomycin 6-kinase
MPAAPISIPPAFAKHIRDGLGEAGEHWLAALPGVLAELSERWCLTLGEPFALSFNYVARARRHDGTDAVLKIGPWPDGELEREIETARLLAGDGMCRLLESDVERRAMLLERVRPGEMLLAVAERDDDAATRIGAEVMRDIWRPIEQVPNPSRFKPLEEWFTRAFPLYRATYGGGGAGPFPEPILARGESIARELFGSEPRPVLLHADFHHYNVLSSDRAGWLAIDPKGMLGDPGYEVGPFLLNPWGTPKSSALLARRLDIFADDLGYDRGRLHAWGIAHAVLSACWCTEGDGGDWQSAIATAENLIAL